MEASNFFSAVDDKARDKVKAAIQMPNRINLIVEEKDALVFAPYCCYCGG